MSEIDKKKALFEALDAVERNFNKSTNSATRSNDEISSNHANRRNSYKIDKYKNKNSIFKKPSLPLRRCLAPQKRPDHELHPEKFTYYSLKDVDTSDHTNKDAAFSFLREMEQRKSTTDNDEGESSSSQPKKIVFKNSTKLKSINEDQDKSIDKRMQGNKFIMSEYVVGEKKKKKIDKKVSSGEKKQQAQLNLSHLYDDE